MKIETKMNENVWQKIKINTKNCCFKQVVLVHKHNNNTQNIINFKSVRKKLRVELLVLT